MRNILQRTAPGELTSKVRRTICERIASGALLPGHYVPSERDLGRLLRVSRVTVRRGLDHLVREGILRREPGRGYVLRDRSRPENDGAPRARPNAIVFVHDLPESALVAGAYHAAMWAGAREEAARAGFLTLISALGVAPAGVAWAAELAKVAAGILSDSSDPAVIRALLEAGVPVVVIDYYAGDLPVDAVVQGDSGGIVQAVDHLYRRGHRRIGYLDTFEGLRAGGAARNAEERLAGYTLACRRLSLGAPVIAPAEYVTGDAAAGTAALLDAGVTALVVPHRELWSSVAAVLRDRRVAIPGDFGVVAWGDPPAGATPVEFPTAVTWSKEQMGREGARRLILRLERPDLAPATIVIPTRLIDRGTGGRRPAA